MFKHKVVLITGGSAAKEGASVAIVERNETKLTEVAERCSKNGVEVYSIKADISKDEEADIIVKQTVEKFGKLDVLVNNAGVFKQAHILEQSFLETFDEAMNVNIRATARITRHAAPYLIESKGNIVNVSSVAGTSVRLPKFIAYRTSKAALNYFTRCCALDLSKYGVRVNSVSPGPVKTNLFEGANFNIEVLQASTALHRVSECTEIADLILYLASDKAHSITGSDYVIDNGLNLR